VFDLKSIIHSIITFTTHTTTTHTTNTRLKPDFYLHTMHVMQSASGQRNECNHQPIATQSLVDVSQSLRRCATFMQSTLPWATVMKRYNKWLKQKNKYSARTDYNQQGCCRQICFSICHHPLCSLSCRTVPMKLKHDQHSHAWEVHAGQGKSIKLSTSVRFAEL